MLWPATAWLACRGLTRWGVARLGVAVKACRGLYDMARRGGRGPARLVPVRLVAAGYDLAVFA